MTQRNVRIVIFLSTTLLFVAAAGLLVSRVSKLDRDGILGVTYQAARSSEAEEKLAADVPMFGHFLTPGRVILALKDAPAERAGVRAGDRIRALDGVPIDDLDALRRIESSKRAGDDVTLEWTSGTVDHAARVKLESPLRNPNLYLSPAVSCFVATAFFLIGTLVLRAKKDDRAALVFHVLTSIAAGFFLAWALFEIQVQGQRGIMPNLSLDPTAIGVFAVYGILALMMTAALLHFALVFPRPFPWILRFPRVIVLLYLVGILQVCFMLAAVTIGSTRTQPWAALAIVSLALAVLGLLLRARRGMKACGWEVFARRPIETWVMVSACLLLAVQALRLFSPVVYFVATTVLYTAGIIVVSFGFPLGALGLFLTSYMKSSDEDRRQFRWPLFGLIVSLGGIVLVGIAGFVIGFSTGFGADPSLIYTQTTIQSAGKLFYLLIPISFAFGILRYRLMEIEFVVRKTLVYSIVSALVLVFYLVLVGVIGTWLIRWSGVKDQLVIVMSTLGVALVFVPMRNWVQTIVDRGFFRHRANLQRSMRQLGSRLNETDDLGRMLRIVAEEVRGALQLEAVAVLAGEAGRPPAFAAHAPAGSQVERVMALPIDRGLFTARGPQAPGSLTLDPDTRETLERAGVRRVCAPHADRGAVAVILGGEKLSGQEWDDDDDEFLATVAERMTLSVETARLRIEEEEFRQAQTIQRSLLPREIPQLERFRVSGFWQPARAVGGDYYDAIRLDDERIAVCVGDVVGKGMPAAILMSSLQAGVRALADAATPSAEIVTRARRVVIPSLEGGKFITFFYGVLDQSTNELRYTNAGHNPPIVIRADGSTIQLETGGPAIARLFAATPYETGSVDLRAGDRVVIFTDGLTEAEDEGGRAFGEDGIMEVVKRTGAATAGELQSALVTAVLRHTGGTLQDDLTLVVIEVS